MTRSAPSLRPAVALVAGLLCTLASTAMAASVQGAVVDRYPDIAMSYPSDLRIQTTSSGARRLRLTTMIVNIGKGPFETTSSRLPEWKEMIVNQRIYNSAGGYRVHVTSGTTRYAGDGHDHWHVRDIAHYSLFSITGEGPALRRDSKVGFCFFDTTPYRLSLPRAPSTPKYSEAACGSRKSTFTKNGISVGWGDKYGWRLNKQWINLGDLPAGDYFLKLEADPLYQFLEIRHTNNCNWTKIRISKSSSVVRTLDRGFGCVLPGQEG